MNRRDFVKTGAAVAVAGTTRLQARPAAKARKPNVLYVFSDQHRAFSMPGVPHSKTIAPNFAAFRDAHCSMEQCVSNYPLCAPYRAIFMSGMYPQQSGQMGNKDILDPGKITPLGETFRNAGYHTGYIGKWHLHGQVTEGRFDEDLIPKGPYRMGFEHWQVWADTDDHYHSWTFNQDTGERIYPQGWQPVRMTDEAIDFMKAQPNDKPWLLVLSWNPPHPKMDPPEEFRSQYPLDQIEFRPNLIAATEGGAGRRAGRREDALRTYAQGYQGNITGVDNEFARVLKALEDTGHADNTIIVYTSDHGEMMGSQGLTGKRVPYEESCRVPFVVRYPGVTLEQHKSDLLFSAIDIYPTLCGLAGVPVPAHCAGRDLSGAMRGHKIQEPAYVFMLSSPEGAGAKKGAGAGAAGEGTEDSVAEGVRAVGGARGGCPPYRGVRTKTHTYIVADTGRWLLFDNIADPYQMKNLVGDASQKALMNKLDVEVEAWLRSVKDEFPYAAATGKIYS